MNDATLPWTVSDLILFFKQQKIKDLHFFLNWYRYRYLCCELVKLNLTEQFLFTRSRKNLRLHDNGSQN